MAIRKRKTKTGVSWGYYFDAPGSTRENRIQFWAGGLESKKAVQEAEAQRRIDERLKAEARARGGSLVAAPVPKLLGQLLDEFLREHCDRNLALKTVDRYRDHAADLSPELKAMPIMPPDEITSLHCTREWNRLRDSGGHHRKTKEARPLSAKSVPNIAGFVSSAFAWAIGEGLLKVNPVTASTKPRGGKRPPVALSPAQQRLLVDSSTHWFLPDFLEFDAGLGARRGEVLALRWSDIWGDEARIVRSLSQAKGVLTFKEVKTPAGNRTLTIPASGMVVLERIRESQAEFRIQFGPSYRTDLDLIFCNPDGSPVMPDSISSAVSALCRRLKLPKGASLHTLRHTHGSQLLADGMELPAVSARLGHSSPQVTAKIYAHILSGRDRESARRWEALQEKRVDGKELKQ
jgi:integrase